jgi:hypothetical protein
MPRASRPTARAWRSKHATASSGEPVPLPIDGFVQAEYRRQFDLLPDGRQFVVLIPKRSQ